MATSEQIRNRIVELIKNNEFDKSDLLQIFAQLVHEGILENVDEVKQLIQNNDLKSKIETGKAYLIEGEIKLIRPEITPELLDLKVSQKEKDMYY